MEERSRFTIFRDEYLSSFSSALIDLNKRIKSTTGSIGESEKNRKTSIFPAKGEVEDKLMLKMEKVKSVTTHVKGALCLSLTLFCSSLRLQLHLNFVKRNTGFTHCHFVWNQTTHAKIIDIIFIPFCSLNVTGGFCAW